MGEARRTEFATRRRAVGLTQSDLAELLRIEVRTVGRWEAGVGEPQPWQRLSLARALKITAEELQRLLSKDSHQLAQPAAASLSLITLADAEQIEQLAINLTNWDHAHGGSLARIAALASDFQIAVVI